MGCAAVYFMVSLNIQVTELILPELTLAHGFLRAVLKISVVSPVHCFSPQTCDGSHEFAS